VVNPPANGTVTLNTLDGSFTYTPAANFNGTDSFTYQVNDGTLASNVATVTLTVTPINDAPVAANDSYTTNENTPLTVAAGAILANDTDVEGGALTVSLVSGPANGTVRSIRMASSPTHLRPISTARTASPTRPMTERQTATSLP
jgi:VCBS repeat-containing protein